MADMLRCSRCGVPLVASVPCGPCPACLLALAVESSSRPLGAAAGAPVLTATPVRIGPYRILETLGEGGMGVVYLAEQDEPLRRRVAVKVIKLGMDTREVVSRFDSERQAVALMDHPNIASVYDAGATDDGRPYFVMEYVPGIPITEYCDRHRLNTRARLALFTDVCAAVQHAHQKGIIHRDLKPTNVLVMEQDGRGVPKVIDFGVAKAIDQRLTERTLFTAHGLLVGTPEYMSPEQASLGATDVDTRTDIYSLGVLLYELLVGATPFSTRGLRQAGYDELRRVIREEDPVRPSTRVDTLGADAADIAERRHTDTTALRRQLRGDLDWIMLKALDKDPGRRYESASEFAADVGRHLSDEPVIAGPPSRSYRLGKLIRRNRAVVTGLAAVLVVLLAGFVTSSALYFRSETARRQAETEAALNRLDAKALQAALWADANTYRTLSKEAMTLHRRTLGPENPALASYLVNYALVSELAFSGGSTPDVQTAIDEALMLIERGLTNNDTSLVAPLLLLSESSHVDGASMSRLRRRAFDLVTRERQRGPSDDTEQVSSLADLLETETAESVPEDDIESAIRTAREIVSLRRSARAPKPASLARSLERLAVLLARDADRRLRTGDFEVAEDAYREAVSRAKESGRFKESQIATIESQLGRCLLATRSFSEAEDLLLESYAVLWAKLGNLNAATQQALTSLVELYATWGKPKDAAKYRKRLPAIYVARVSDLGTVHFVPRGNRDGGFSAALNGKHVWVFQNTSLPGLGGRPAEWLDGSWGWAQIAEGGRGLTVSSGRGEQATRDTPLIPLSDDEAAADGARQGPGCREDCGFRSSLRPGPVIWDAVRQRALLFYSKKFGPSPWKETHIGASIALWPDFNAPAQRLVLRQNAPEPTLLFDADEPPWGSGALTVADSLYAYACRGCGDCLLARVALEHALDRASWRFYSGSGNWSENWRLAKPVFSSGPTLTVHWNAYLGKYIALGSCISSVITIRTADRPEGPWSDSLLVEGVPGTQTFPWIGSVLAHRELTRGGGRVETVTYVRDIGFFRKEMRLVEIEFRR